MSTLYSLWSDAPDLVGVDKCAPNLSTEGREGPGTTLLIGHRCLQTSRMCLRRMSRNLGVPDCARSVDQCGPVWAKEEKKKDRRRVKSVRSLLQPKSTLESLLGSVHPDGTRFLEPEDGDDRSGGFPALGSRNGTRGGRGVLV